MNPLRLFGRPFICTHIPIVVKRGLGNGLLAFKGLARFFAYAKIWLCR